MTAAVAPPSPLSDASALARRKRMGILPKSDASGKAAAAADNAQVPPKKRCCIRTISEDPAGPVPVTNKKAKTAAASTNEKKKKEGPKKQQKQKKYDPGVPMTKEEAAAWRKEQRRNRNRESAAASRQRQRDRIAELEGEVAEWKGRFAEAMERLRRLEAEAEKSTSGSFKPAQEAPEDILRINTTDPQERKNSIVSPCSSRNSSPQPSPSLSFVQSPSSLVDTSRHPVGEPKQRPKEEEEQQKHHLIETISRPAKSNLSP